MAEETSIPTVDELEAKSARLTGDVETAQKALTVAKKTFADAAKSDPTAVESLLELAMAVKSSEGAVSTAQRAVSGNQTAIAGIRYDEDMADVLGASERALVDVRGPVTEWFAANKGIVSDYSIDTLTIVAKLEESGTVTVSVKPTGENMPKRPSTRKSGGNGERGPRGTHSVTVNGVGMTCREYVMDNINQASPAVQDALLHESGKPFNITHEAKRLATKNNDTFN